MSVSQQERRDLSELLAEAGPDAPTLCEGWTTRDLLAHLLVRERRPDAALGILVPPLAKRTERVMASIAEQPFEDMVRTFRAGPPMWSPFALPLLGDRANLFEFYIHHEDVRRAQPGWEPRPTDAAREAALWGGLSTVGRLLVRRSPVGVVLRAPGHDDAVVHKGPRPVFLVGPPSELALVVYGRPTARTRVVLQGEPDDVAAFEAAPRGI